MMRKDPPFTPGQEICGQVVEVGEGVTNVTVGQQAQRGRGWNQRARPPPSRVRA